MQSGRGNSQGARDQLKMSLCNTQYTVGSTFSDCLRDPLEGNVLFNDALNTF